MRAPTCGLAALRRRASLCMTRQQQQQQQQSVEQQWHARALYQGMSAAAESDSKTLGGTYSASRSSSSSSFGSSVSSQQGTGSHTARGGPHAPPISTLLATVSSKGALLLPRPTPARAKPSWLRLALAAAHAQASFPPGLGALLRTPQAPASLRAFATNAGSSSGGGGASNAGSQGAGRGGRRGYLPPVQPVGPRKNQEIRAKDVRVIFPQGEEKPPTVMSLQDALKEAKHRKLDLVEVTSAADPPVCKIADYEKVLYEARKKARANEKAAREAKRLSEPKEVRVGCHIAEHDLDVKMEKARQFVEEGHHLRLVVTFKGGRELQLGRDMVSFLLDKLHGLVTVKNPKQLEKPQQNQWAVLLAPAVQKPAKAG